MLSYIKNILDHEVTNSLKNDKIERLYAFYLKRNSDVVDDFSICGVVELGYGDKHGIDPSTVSFSALKSNYFDIEADALVIMHNHPKILITPVLSPSDEDIQSTFCIAVFAQKNKMKLLDHIIVDSKNYYSFIENGLIEFDLLQSI